MGNPRSSNSSSLRVLAVLLIVGCFALGGTVAGAVLYVRHVFQSTLTKTAQAAGIKLNLGQVSYGVGFVQLFDSQFELTRVPGVTGNIKRIDIDLTGLHPSKLLLSGLVVNAKGEPFALYQALTQYAEQLQRLRFDSSPKSRPPVVEVKHLEVHATLSHPLLTTLDVTELELTRAVGKTKDQTVLSTAATRVNATQLGPLSLVFREKAGEVEVGWGKTLERTEWTLVYRDGAQGTGLALAFKSVDLSSLFARFGQTAPPEALAKANLSGTLTALLEPSTSKIMGKAALSLTGFVPPLPTELKGYAFKDKTQLLASFQSDPLFSSIALPVIQLNNGDLELVGNGHLERTDLSAKLRADLSARLDCVTLAKGYAKDELGGALGQWGQRNAAKALRGSVAVRVQVEADTLKLADAKVVKRVSVGCGLRPIALVDLLTLELPPPPDAKTAERVVKLLTKNGKLTQNPALLPSLLPSLDEIIDVNLKAK